jgi:hypothetical protein
MTLLACFNLSIAVTSFVVHSRAQPSGAGALKKDQDKEKTGIARITPITGRKLTPIATIRNANSRKATPQVISKSLSSRQSFRSIFQILLCEILSILITCQVNIDYMEVKTCSPLVTFFRETQRRTRMKTSRRRVHLSLQKSHTSPEVCQAENYLINAQ